MRHGTIACEDFSSSAGVGGEQEDEEAFLEGITNPAGPSLPQLAVKIKLPSSNTWSHALLIKPGQHQAGHVHTLALTCFFPMFQAQLHLSIRRLHMACLIGQHWQADSNCPRHNTMILAERHKAARQLSDTGVPMQPLCQAAYTAHLPARTTFSSYTQYQSSSSVMLNCQVVCR